MKAPGICACTGQVSVCRMTLTKACGKGLCPGKTAKRRKKNSGTF